MNDRTGADRSTQPFKAVATGHPSAGASAAYDNRGVEARRQEGVLAPNVREDAQAKNGKTIAFKQTERKDQLDGQLTFDI